MTTQISLDNIQQATLNTIGSGPRITSVVVTDSSYNNLDDTAVDTAGGFIKILGAGFKTGCTVTVNRQQATSVVFVSATEIRAQIPAETAGTYVVYVVNTDGSVALRVNGVTFSALPAWTTGSTLPSGDSGSAVSIQLAAAQATQYTLAQGSTLPPGLTLSSSGLLSGTVTVASETLYNFQVVATDAQLQDSPRTFSITISVGDPLFAQTTLLLPGSANTFVRDASTNNFAVTVVGDTRPNNFNPYLTGWSNSFTGSGDFLTLPSSSSAYNFGSGVDFTVEAWIYPTLLAGASWGIIDARVSAATSAAWIVHLVPSSGTYRLEFFNAGTNTGTAVIPLNTWTHVAVVRNGTALRTYVNGVLDLNLPSYGSGPISPGTTSPRVGPTKDASGTTYTTVGNISNLRIVNGTALYTSNFTPSTQPLTAISGTSLLTCQSNRFRDLSTNNFAITTTGSVAIDSFSPFQEPATTNGSGFFDGTGDYLSASGNAAFAMSTGNFTYEAWVYPISIPTYSQIIAQFSTLSTGAGSFAIPLNSSRQIELYYDGQTYATFSSATVTLNAWNHVAIVRSGSTITGYINGVVAGTVTYSGIFGSSSTNLEIGATTRTGSPDQFVRGYISNVRIVKGTALYTAAFTPPTAPLTAVANTSLLTLQTNQPHNNSQFLDSSSENHLITRNGNTTQGTFSPYSPSGWSNFFDGSGDSLSYTGTTFGTSAYTIECWFNISNFSTAYALLSTNNANALNIRINNATTIAIDQQNVAQVTFTVPAMGTNTWHHIAVVRNSSNICTVFVNGVRSSTGQTTISTNYNAASNLIGLIGSNAFPGYISNLRAVVGTALYDPTLSTLTVPTQPLTAVPGTSLLTCCDNRLIDDSVNNFAITRVGDVRVTNFSPFRAQTQVPNTYSAFFNGTGNYLGVTNTAFPTNSTSWTVEGYFYINSITSTVGLMAVPDLLMFYIASTGTAITVEYRNNSNWTINTSSATFLAGQWYHIAAVLNSGSLRVYVNGVAVGTASTGVSTGSNGGSGGSTIFIGATDLFPFGSPDNNLTGYISNFRIASLAVYTANFTPPTAPLAAIAGTTLLTCQSPTFTDNSTNRFAITAFGNSQPSMVNPFGFTFTPSTGYSAAAHGGSLYFSATSAYVLAAMNGNDSFGTRDFTVDLWFYPLNSAINISFPNANTNTWGILTFNNQLYWQENGGNLGGVGYGTVVQGSWNHIAVCRSGSTIRFFINGVQVGSLSNSFNYSGAPTNRSIGPRDGGGVPAYISNFRIVRGTALYTSNFAPPIAPVQPVAGTVLLVNGSNAAVTDATTKNVLETVGDTAVSTLISRTGGSSMRFDNNGDYLIIPYTPLFAQTRPYTVEFWFYPNYNFSGQYIFARNAGGYFCLNYNGSTTRMIVDRHGVGTQITGANNMPLNQWHHFAMTYDGTTTRTFANGVLDGSVVGTGGEANDVTTIGFYTAVGSSSFGGYISDFRFTTGTARYTTNFTPPAGAFQTR